MSEASISSATRPAKVDERVKPSSVAMIAWPALGMLMVASVGSIAQLSDSATFGWGAVTVYLLPSLLFLVPVGLVSAELATSNRGGIFVWVRDAYGDKSGLAPTSVGGMRDHPAGVRWNSAVTASKKELCSRFHVWH